MSLEQLQTHIAFYGKLREYFERRFVNGDDVAGQLMLKVDEGIADLKLCKQSLEVGTCPSCERSKVALGGFFAPVFGNDVATGIAAISMRCGSSEAALKNLKEAAAEFTAFGPPKEGSDKYKAAWMKMLTVLGKL